MYLQSIETINIRLISDHFYFYTVGTGWQHLTQDPNFDFLDLLPWDKLSFDKIIKFSF